MIQHFGIASAQIAAYVDVGCPLISETFLSEIKLNRGLTTHEGIKKLRLKFAQGVHGFDRGGGFVGFDKKAMAAIKFVHTCYLVSILYDTAKYCLFYPYTHDIVPMFVF